MADSDKPKPQKPDEEGEPKTETPEELSPED
jgi:hypothetical protein